MPKLFNGVVKLTESHYNFLKTFGSITVNGTTIKFDENTLYVTDYAIDDELDINSENPVKNSVLTKALEEKTSNGVTLDTIQTIKGDKNFEANIKKYGIDLATINDVPKLVDGLDSESSTSSLSAKQGKVLNDKISSLISSMNGKFNTFTILNLSELLSLFDYPVQEGDKGQDSYMVGKSQINYKGEIINLKTGDTFYIVDLSAPDYWFSLEEKTLYKLETNKIDFSLYALKTDIPETLPASDVYSWAKQLNKPDYDFVEIKNIPDWIKSSTKPTYTAEEVGALSKLPDNVVLTNSNQNISGHKVFEEELEIGKTSISTQTGISNIRLVKNDKNNVHETSYFIDENGYAKIIHTNRSVNVNNPDSYIYFNHGTLKYGTGGANGTTVSSEYDIITSKGGTFVGGITLQDSIGIHSSDSKNLLTCYTQNKSTYVNEYDKDLYLQGKQQRPYYINGEGKQKILALNEDIPSIDDLLPLNGSKSMTGALTLNMSSKGAEFGIGQTDVYIKNSTSNKYLQIKDDGTLSYSDNPILTSNNYDSYALPLDGSKEMIGQLKLSSEGLRTKDDTGYKIDEYGNLQHLGGERSTFSIKNSSGNTVFNMFMSTGLTLFSMIPKVGVNDLALAKDIPTFSLDGNTLTITSK